MGSATELEYFLLLSRDLGLVPNDSWRIERADSLGSTMLGSLVRKVDAEQSDA